MTEDADLRQQILRVLAHHAGPAADAEALAAAADRAFDDFARVSAQLIGQAGVDALTGRALHVAEKEYPWLVNRQAAGEPQERFSNAVVCLKGQDPVVAADAAASMLAALAALHVTFIGESLTSHLLRKAWGDALSAVNAEDITS